MVERHICNVLVRDSSSLISPNAVWFIALRPVQRIAADQYAAYKWLGCNRFALIFSMKGVGLSLEKQKWLIHKIILMIAMNTYAYAADRVGQIP